MTMRHSITTAMLALIVLFAPSGPARAQSGDCSGAAEQVVAQTGGQLLSASAENQGGQNVCSITVLVPGQGNERPKKVTVNVPI